MLSEQVVIVSLQSCKLQYAILFLYRSPTAVPTHILFPIAWFLFQFPFQFLLTEISLICCFFFIGAMPCYIFCI